MSQQHHQLKILRLPTIHNMKLVEQKGFTLIELMVYVLIFGLVVIGIITFSIDLSTTSQKARKKVELQQQMRFALDRILQEVSAAESINTGTSTFDVNPSILELDVVNASDNPTRFVISSNVLTVQQGVASPEQLTSDGLIIDNFTVTNLSNGNRTKSVLVELTASYDNPNNSELLDVSVTLSGSATIRKGSNP